MVDHAKKVGYGISKMFVACVHGIVPTAEMDRLVDELQTGQLATAFAHMYDFIAIKGVVEVRNELESEMKTLHEMQAANGFDRKLTQEEADAHRDFLKDLKNL